MSHSNNKKIVKDGIWFRDTYGRFVLFRGVNFSSQSKLFPYLPIAPKGNDITSRDIKNEINRLKPFLNNIKKSGFNIVRLLVMWKPLEPTPNYNLNSLSIEGQKYVTLLNEIITELKNLEVYIILDFHQDIAHEIYGGDGFPDWALAIDELHPRPPYLKIPNKNWYLSYYTNPFVIHTLKSFWKNSLTNIEFNLQDFPVRNHLEKTICLTVKYLKELNSDVFPFILGIEPFNEPHQLDMDRNYFESIILSEFYNNIMSELKIIDPNLFLFLEPRTDWIVFPVWKDKLESLNLESLESNFLSLFDSGDSNKKTFLPKDPSFIDKFKLNGVLSFHYYDPWTFFYSMFNLSDSMASKFNYWSSIFSILKNGALERNLVPFLTEFGGSHDWDHYKTDLKSNVYKNKQIRAYIDLQYKQIELNLLNSTYWNYNLYNTKEGNDNWNHENFSILDNERKMREIDIICRPYPMLSSSEPVAFSFDLETKYFVLITKGLPVKYPTMIYVPYMLHYAPLFKVYSTNNNFTWDRNNQVLSWTLNEELLFNKIIITPDVEFNPSLIDKNIKFNTDDIIGYNQFN